jgi:hypothetical protein
VAHSALNDGLPPSVTLKAGPFISNEEAKVILILDIPDHSTIFGVFSGVVETAWLRKGGIRRSSTGLISNDRTREELTFEEVERIKI